MADDKVIGFIGLGVMGEPMCRNIAKKSGKKVIAYDVRPEPQQRLSRDGVEAASSIADLVRRVDVVLLSLPGEPEVRSVCLGDNGVLANCRAGQAIVDCSTAPVPLAQELHAAFAAKGAEFADAPVARTAQAAIDGTLSIMVGGDDATFARVKPYLDCMGADVTHCGKAGAGEAVKLLNNMVVAMQVVALAEALTVARESGAVDGKILFETIAKSSGDSFVLRNHGMKSMLPGTHPTEGAFPTTYIIKDLSYALGLAEQAGVSMESANVTKKLLERTRDAGFAKNYYTAVVEVIEKTKK